MPKALHELSKVMRTGRAYKIIHAILNISPRRRMIYPQTTGRYSTLFISSITSN